MLATLPRLSRMEILAVPGLIAESVQLVLLPLTDTIEGLLDETLYQPLPSVIVRAVLFPFWMVVCPTDTLRFRGGAVTVIFTVP